MSVAREKAEYAKSAVTWLDANRGMMVGGGGTTALMHLSEFLGGVAKDYEFVAGELEAQMMAEEPRAEVTN